MVVGEFKLFLFLFVVFLIDFGLIEADYIGFALFKVFFQISLTYHCSDSIQGLLSRMVIIHFQSPLE